MSRPINRSNGYINIDDWVSFDYEGLRLVGQVVRTSSNPTYFHVDVDGQRYEVDSQRDEMVVH